MTRPRLDEITQRLAIGAIERAAGGMRESRPDVDHPRGTGQHSRPGNTSPGQDQRRAALAGVEAAVLAEVAAALGPIVARSVDHMQVRAAARVSERGGQPAYGIGIAVALVGWALLRTYPVFAGNAVHGVLAGDRRATRHDLEIGTRLIVRCPGGARGVGDHQVLALAPGDHVDDLCQCRGQEHVEGGVDASAGGGAPIAERHPC